MTSSGGKKLNRPVVWIAAAVAVAGVSVGATAFIMSKNSPAQPAVDTSSLAIPYAAEATVMLDENSLQAMMDEAMANAERNYVGLRYQNIATSKDGVNFSCFIMNSGSNKFDMFLTICADPEMTDQLYLSGLVPPGSGFEEITLNRPLEHGLHTVYVAVTQVEVDEHGEQTIVNQVIHTMDFVVD